MVGLVIKGFYIIVVIKYFWKKMKYIINVIYYIKNEL